MRRWHKKSRYANRFWTAAKRPQTVTVTLSARAWECLGSLRARLGALYGMGEVCVDTAVEEAVCRYDDTWLDGALKQGANGLRA